MGMTGIEKRLHTFVARISGNEARRRPSTDHPYECIVCKRAYAFEYSVCPERGSYSVESRNDAHVRLTREPRGD